MIFVVWYKYLNANNNKFKLINLNANEMKEVNLLYRMNI